jgi:predicted amidohydrolase YtcJ
MNFPALTKLASRVGLGTALVACAAQPPASSLTSAHAEAELVLRNGAVLTMDPARPRARSVAISSGRIVFVGEDPSPWIGRRTRVVELAGRTVIPALTDAHAHLVSLGETLEQVNLEGCASPEACADRVRATAAEASTAWIRGRGWDQNRFTSRRFPSHDALDRITAKRPIWLRRIDGHAGWANARALELAGVDRRTADPAGGRLLRDGAGDPTGVFVDNAMDLIEKAIPPATDDARERAILSAQAVALEHGLTEVHEMGIDDRTVRVYRRLAKASKLRVRVYAFRSASTLDATLSSMPDVAAPYSFFTVRGIKLYADGALGSRGAALLAPYSDEPENVGLLVTPPETIERAATRALASGWQVAVHAIGDRANRSVLDAFEHAGCASKPEHRFRIEHAQVLDASDMPRLRALGVIASMQPTHATSDMPWAESRLGKSRLAGAYAWRRVLDSGAKVAWGSDFPVEGVSVLAGLHAAVTRTDAEGHPTGGWLPDQRLSLDEALDGFTSGAAFAAFEESWRGRAAIDQAADLTVFDRDLSDGKALLQARVALTIVGGKVEFERK